MTSGLDAPLGVRVYDCLEMCNFIVMQRFDFQSIDQHAFGCMMS